MKFKLFPNTAPGKCLLASRHFPWAFVRRLPFLPAAVLFLTLLASCAPQYFSPVHGDAFTRKDLRELSGRELWHGFVFNGEKVGFARLKIEPDANGQAYTLFSEASLRIRFLGMGKSISIRGEDRVAPDLSLISFQYEQTMDDKPLILKGETDAILLDVPDALVALQKFPGKIKIIGPMSGTQDMAVAFAKESPKLREEFNKFFAGLKQSGEYAKMIKKYYPFVTTYFPHYFDK